MRRDLRWLFTVPVAGSWQEVPSAGVSGGNRSPGSVAAGVIAGLGSITAGLIQAIDPDRVFNPWWWMLPAVIGLLAYGFLLHGCVLWLGELGFLVSWGIFLVLFLVGGAFGLQTTPWAEMAGLGRRGMIGWSWLEFYERPPTNWSPWEPGPWPVFVTLHLFLGSVAVALGAWSTRRYASQVRARKEALLGGLPPAALLASVS
jgi:hypothetical protein